MNKNSTQKGKKIFVSKIFNSGLNLSELTTAIEAVDNFVFVQKGAFHNLLAELLHFHFKKDFQKILVPVRC